ncbi:MAG: hypothetical protein WCP97_00430 [bacterium]
MEKATFDLLTRIEGFLTVLINERRDEAMNIIGDIAQLRYEQQKRADSNAADSTPSQ